MSISGESINLLKTLSNQLADAVALVSPALVQVNGRQRQSASGVVFAPDLIMTADHVLEREDNITIVTHDGRTLEAAFVGRDISTDLAVLKVSDLNISPANVATEDARVGQLALAIGRPDGNVMASSGIVSAVGGPLRFRSGGTLEKYLQTDATPYPGFSGGPLIDVEGLVLGILTTGLARGVTLSIPASIALASASTLSQQGYIKRGYLGISSQAVEIPAAQRAGREQEHGLLIVRVDADTPAAGGGMLLGDILLSLDGQKVDSVEDLQALLTGERVGKAVAVEVIRGGQLQTLTVTIGQRK
ncbi:MAG: trypsin-like peptidase domain-containing protein [Chloroflexi bacterium]|uniref:S1C family serine protease n=1 Tax=Candidatus Chlorohelix allophototropha TaxID=3003348 RepID=A0A8T7LXF9_9CHLR|nr:trypsin-like peptidase domain-containing protein [Chloroflexota bacterium]WJW66028.1 S1C family serine protease [Chloroflexota bacterium L227-S17]